MASKRDIPIDRKRVYEIAARVFHNQGYDNASMQDVAGALGLTKAGLYHHVESKEHLLNTVIDYALDLPDTHVIAKLRDVHGGVARLEKMIEFHLRMMLDQRNHQVAGLIHECRTLSAKDRARINGRKKEYLDFVTRLIAAALRERKVASVSPRLAAFALLGMLNWTYQWFRPTGLFQPDDIVRGFQQIFLSGLFASAPARKARKKKPA